MKTYEASEELANILVSNGFQEKTAKDYPEHYAYMEKHGTSTSIKRTFSYHSRQDYIKFDYINIHAIKSCSGCGSRITLTEIEVKSLIAFYKMSSDFRHNWTTSNHDIFSFHLYYQKICREPFWYDSATDKKVKKLFETIIFQPAVS